MNRRLEKIILNFTEWCLNTPLFEMVLSRNSAWEKIENKSETINEHLFKVYLMPNSRDREHWLNEINDRFFEIQNRCLWKSNRRFYENEYFQMLYSGFYLKDSNINYRYLDHILSKIEQKYSNEYQIEWSISDFIERSGIFIKKMSKCLEEGDYCKDELLENIKIFNKHDN